MAEPEALKEPTPENSSLIADQYWRETWVETSVPKIMIKNGTVHKNPAFQLLFPNSDFTLIERITNLQDIYLGSDGTKVCFKVFKEGDFFVLVDVTGSITDSLTQAYRREPYKKFLEQIFNSRKPFTLIALDLNDLKKINDQLGHLAGDKLLRNFAKVLMNSVRPTDMVARIGGDEFMIIAPETNPETAQGIVQRIQDNLVEEEISAAIGMAFRDPDKKTEIDSISIPLAKLTPSEQLELEADKKMYLKKAEMKGIKLEYTSLI